MLKSNQSQIKVKPMENKCLFFALLVYNGENNEITISY